MDLGIRTERGTVPAGTGREAPLAAANGPADTGTGKAAPPAGKDLPAAPVNVTVAQALAQVQSYLRENQRQLEFQLDEASGRTVIRVVNPDSGELIRQIPSEEFLQVAANLDRGSLRLIDRLA